MSAAFPLHQHGEQADLQADVRGVLDNLSITDLLGMQAQLRPDAVFLTGLGDAPEPPLTFGHANACTTALALLLEDLQLQPGDAVAILMRNRPEACLAILGALRAGLRPLLLPAHLALGDLIGLVQRTGASAIITAVEPGWSELADTAVTLAATADTVRYVLAFGDDPPDGVLPLSPLLAEAVEDYGSDGFAEGQTERLLVPRPGGDIVERIGSCLVSTAMELAVDADLRAGDILVTTLPPDDGASIAAGLVAGLLTGSAVAPVEASELAGLFETQAEGRRILVWPGALERVAVAEIARHPGSFAACILVHQAPFSRSAGARRSSPAPFVYVMSFDEAAIAVVRRGTDGALRLPSPWPMRPDAAQIGPIERTSLRTDLDGRLWIEGPGIQDRGDSKALSLDYRAFCDWTGDVVTVEPMAKG